MCFASSSELPYHWFLVWHWMTVLSQSRVMGVCRTAHAPHNFPADAAVELVSFEPHTAPARVVLRPRRSRELR